VDECGTAFTRKRPSHELTGIGRFSQLYSENGLLGEMATSERVLALAVATLLLPVGLPGPTGISPSHSSFIRSQDGPSFTHSISASFRNPLGSRAISMRSVHRDFQSPMTHLGRSGAAGSAVFLNIAGSGSHVSLLVAGGLHQGAPVRRAGAPCGTIGILPESQVRPLDRIARRRS
jgi:hypothetical protein